MSQQFIIPTNENGAILDPHVASNIGLALSGPVPVTDVFIASHGWWTNATEAMASYARFSAEFSHELRQRQDLAGIETLTLALHWPSTLTEDSWSPLNYLEALTFFTMQRRADAVGEAAGQVLLKLLLQLCPSPGRPMPRLHLIGHSFGCRVVARAIECLARDHDVPAGVTIDVALLQAAFDNDQLELAKDYTGVADVARCLVTYSRLDLALCELYPKANLVAHLLTKRKLALGALGPRAACYLHFGGEVWQTSIGPGWQPDPSDCARYRLAIAELDPLHAACPELNQPHTGHHSDIFRPEIYRLLSEFFFP